MNRGEFSLNSIGFNEEMEQFLQKKAGDHKFAKGKEEIKLLKMKIDSGLEYQRLLYNVLRKVIQKLSYKVIIIIMEILNQRISEREKI